jgi:2-amino-4-hydroxy-6-hydroxymethyldihydropteridine diphosphokinase
MVICYIALGSNLADRQKNIKLALEFLKQAPAIKILKVSSIIETEPQKARPQPKFLNGVVKLQTSYSAHQLLKKLQEIEVKLGRKTPRVKNEPRTIDLDILLYGDFKIDEKELQIPHPSMWKRRFVAIPLKEIAPELFKQ